MSTTKVSTAMQTNITLGTEQATTSGTSVTFRSIPAGTKQIIISFNGFSLSGTDQTLIQLGDAGGIETTGYVGGGALAIEATATSASSNTIGFSIKTDNAANIVNGHVTITLIDAAAFSWVFSAALDIEAVHGFVGGGTKSLSAELTQLKILTTGSDTMDAGSINILYF